MVNLILKLNKKKTNKDIKKDFTIPEISNRYLL